MRTCSICGTTSSEEDFYRRAWYCKPCYKAKVVAGQIKKFGSLRNRQLWNNYKITGEDFDRMLEEQDGVCAICKNPNTKLWETNRGRFVDHDHLTGQVRGILCIRCNTQLGMLEDKVFVEAAMKYLQEYGRV